MPTITIVFNLQAGECISPVHMFWWHMVRASFINTELTRMKLIGAFYLKTSRF